MSSELKWAAKSAPELRDALSRFVGEMADVENVSFGAHVSAGVFIDRALVGAFVLHNWSPQRGTIELSAGALGPVWTDRRFLTEVLDYAFGRLGCRMVVARTSEHNDRARRMCVAIGAREHLIPQFRGPDEADVVLTLDADTWRSSPYRKVS